jgi:hypothetical protein
MAQPLYAVETAVLRRLAINPSCTFRWTKHVLARMQERNIHAEDVIHALTNGQVMFHETKEDILYRVDGTDLDGKRLQVQVAIYEDIIAIKIVTAF